MTLSAQRTLAPARWWFVALAALLFTTGCTAPALPGLDETAFPVGMFPSDGVVLRIENESGLGVSVDVVFEMGEFQVRRTRRYLAPSGVESVEEVPPTPAERVTVTARVAGGAALPVDVAVGDALAVQVFERDVDYQANGTIVFVIPAPGQPGPEPIEDCNDNGLPDAIEIATGAAVDCDADGTPDDCQLLVDRNGNGTPDVCEVLGDLNGDGILDLDDVPLFVRALLDRDRTPAAVAPADVNLDGVADGRDIQAFLAALLEAR